MGIMNKVVIERVDMPPATYEKLMKQIRAGEQLAAAVSDLLSKYTPTSYADVEAALQRWDEVSK